MWTSGVGTLCANAHYGASLSCIYLNILLKTLNIRKLFTWDDGIKLQQEQQKIFKSVTYIHKCCSMTKITNLIIAFYSNLYTF